MRPSCAALLALVCSAIAVPTAGNHGDGNQGAGGYGADNHGAGHHGVANYGPGSYGQAASGSTGGASPTSTANGGAASASSTGVAASATIGGAASASTGGAAPTANGGAAPTANVKNGTYAGVYNAQYDQDFFLGVPYAQPPVGGLRFRVPQSLNSTWSGTHSAAQYSAECVGYGSDQWNYPISEDCLYLNVIRPAGVDASEDLPVALWIHGGGYYQGGSVDQRYNLSFMVENSVAIGKPVIGVSINYRLSAWGFLASTEVLGSGNTNIGLRDQRLALHWVQENIAAFGGDPKKVTIWGESAGGSSVGFHLTAYGGRDDSLFRGAIMESGNPVFYRSLNGTDNAFNQQRYDYVVQQTNCSDATDTLQCLRELPYTTLNSVLNTTTVPLTSWNPTIDGDFIEKYTSIQLAEGAFVHVPIIDGANTDEGSAFSPQGVNSTQDFYNYITHPSIVPAAPGPFADQLLAAYPDDPTVGIPAELPADFRPGPPFGAQFRRSAAYYGDAVFIAARRLTCQTWAAANVAAYCYRFNAIPAGIPPVIGATHFQEVAFVFYNLAGVGYAPAAAPPFAGKPQGYADLARLMDGSWVSFVHDLDPNSFRAGADRARFAGVPAWPRYDARNPQNFVFDANVTSYAEPDTFRAEGIALINSANAGVYHR